MKRFLHVIILMSALALCGCGTKNKESGQYHFECAQMTDEIRDSKVTDPIVQVGNAVLKTDGSLTVREVMELLDIDGEVQLGNSYTKEDEISSAVDISITRESLAQFGADDKKEVCIISVRPENEGVPTKVADCIVDDIGAAGYGGFNNLNIIYAGNICAIFFTENRMGLPEAASEYGDDLLAAYEQRMEEQPLVHMSFDEAKDHIHSLAESAGTQESWSTFMEDTMLFDMPLRDRNKGDNTTVELKGYFDGSSGNFQKINRIVY